MDASPHRMTGRGWAGGKFEIRNPEFEICDVLAPQLHLPSPTGRWTMKKVLIAGLAVALSSVSMASGEDEMTSLSYISYLERYATVQPVSQEESLEAVINMPLVGGDRVDTAREARMEIVLADGNTMWLDEYTTLSIDAVAYSRDADAERTVIFLAEGTIFIEISEFSLSKKPTRVDGRGATIYLDERGLYRLSALPSGGLRVEVIAGLAEAATSSGGVLVRAQGSAEVGGGEVQRREAHMTWDDDFAAWVEMRRQIPAGESSQHVDLRYSRQAAQLDNYGSWVYVDSINSWAWQPAVGGSWEPYRAGRWYWTATGWAWISYEPWGWLPYHYGSWHFSVGFGWVWSWGNYWGPAWVNWVWWPGYVGWCPYGYYNNWYWNCYGGYYPGYSPPYRPPYPGGGSGAAVPRRDVMPPRRAGKRVGGESTQSRLASQPAVDVNGRVRVSSIDRRGWTVVRQEDFASPHLTRLARAGDRVMPTDSDQMGVVMTGPLTTRSPSRGNPGSELERTFRRVEAMNPVDVSPVMARDPSVSSETIRQLGRRTTIADLSSRSAAFAAENRSTEAPRLSVNERSPFHSAGGQRSTRPNLFRSTIYGSTGGASSGSSVGDTSTGSRTLVAPRSSTGRTVTSRPVIVPGSNATRYSRPTVSPPGSSAYRGPTTRSPSSVGTGSRRYAAPSTRSVGGTRSSGGSSRSSVGSSRSSRPSSRSSAGSSRSSGATSRPSSGSTSRPSGGATKKQ
jgi:hypothetical protein